MRFTTALLLGALAVSAGALPSASNDFVVHEAASTVPGHWKYVGPANPSMILPFSLALRQTGIQELKARLDLVSKPEHESFGDHLSREQLRSYQDVSDDTVEAVVGWLRENSIEDFQQDNAWMRFNASVAAVNRLLNCDMSEYRKAGSKALYRAREYSLPQDLVNKVDFVYPVTQFMAKKTKNATSKRAPVSTRAITPRGPMPASCGNNVVPDCVVDLYNLTYIPPDNLSGSQLGIAGFLEQYPNNEYVHSFLADHSPRRNATGYSSDYNFTVESVNGGNATDAGAGVEAILDVEYSMPFTQPLDVIYYSTGGRGPQIDESGYLVNETVSEDEPWIEFLEYMLAKESIPQVLSISYTDDEQDIPLAYAQKVCDLFMQVAARGVSVLIASGDGGSAGIGHEECYTNEGVNKTVKFLPTFPVDCPYVTSVGASAIYGTDQAASLSSGGFSDYFARPAWQQDVAESYVSRLNGTHDGFYNASGRGIPDIAAIGSRFLVQAGQYEWTQSGTSASTPVVAAMIALVNDKRLRAGKSALGFLNPILYSANVSSAFFDITQGSSGSCSFGDKFEHGWDAMSGWDPTTGLGTINFPKLLELLG